MRKFNITVNGNTYSVDVEEVGAGAPAAAPVQAAPVQAAPVQKAAPAPVKAAPAATGSKKVESPMPGTIVSVKVKAGDTVNANTLVAVLEAMKMENEIFAGVEGTVASVNVSAGDSVNSGDVIVSVN